MKIIIDEVVSFPEVMDNGTLYFSKRFRCASHLCACGCGEKVITPIGDIDWKLEFTSNGPTLFPSIGNWNLPCRSHYWIREGEIIWASHWSDEKIARSFAKERAMRTRLSHRSRFKEPNLFKRLKRLFRRN